MRLNKGGSTLSKHIGKIVQVIGPVVDVMFESQELPELMNAVEIPLENEAPLVAEVAQHIGDDRVRCVAMGSTDGLKRGMKAIDSEAPISVPVGKEVLGLSLINIS